MRRIGWHGAVCLAIGMVGFWGITSRVSSAAAAAGQASSTTLSLPSGPGSIEGLGGSFEPQLNTGTAPYSLEIDAPKGANGTDPGLSLSYSSGLGNGHFGIGWTMSVPSISREVEKGQPGYAEGDVFVVSDGEELVPLGDDTWRAENESAFMRFKRSGDGWTAVDRSGRTYLFGMHGSGQPEASRVEKPGASSFDATYRWYLESTEDTNGNRIEYRYTSFPSDSPGELYLTEVRWNVIGSSARTVTIDYELRPDAFTDYRSGFKRRTGRRGKRIVVRDADVLIREYVLDYALDDVAELMDPQASGAVDFAISLLRKVTQLDNGGRSIQVYSSTPPSGARSHLPPLRFSYTRLFTVDADNLPQGQGITNTFPGPEDVDLNGNGVLDLTGPATRRVVGAPIQLSFLSSSDADFFDADGDGLSDVLEATVSGHQYYRNLGNSTFDTNPIPMGGFNPHIPLSSSSSTLADMDGDGLADFVNDRGDGSLVVFRNQGRPPGSAASSWSSGVEFAPAPLFGISGSDVRLLDVNFDKAIDVVRSLSNSSWMVCINRNTADVDLPPFGNFGLPGAAEDIDRNGNHVLDGSSFDCSVQDVPFPPQVRFGNPGSDVQLADMNGDRLLDVVYLQATSASRRVAWFWPNMGGGHFDSPTVMSATGSSTGELSLFTPLSAGTNDSLKLADVNGDGISDLVQVANGLVRLWLNLGGDQWSQQVDILGTPFYDPASTSLRMVDINGNGSSDLVFINPVGPVDERWQYLDFTPLAKPNQLKLIDNGLGRRTEITYRTTTDFMIESRDVGGNPWSTTAPFPVPVVSKVVTTPSLDLDSVPGDDLYVSDLAYRDPYYDPYEHEFRGFAFAKKIERGDADAPTSVTRLFFHTGAPDGEDNDGDGAVDERTAKGGGEEEPLKGKLLREETTTDGGGADSSVLDGKPLSDGVVFERKDLTWRISQLHGPASAPPDKATLDERGVAFAFKAREEKAVIEQGRGPGHVVRTDWAYDDYGNVVEEKQYGSLSITGDERFTFTRYAQDVSRWILDKPCEVEVRDAEGTRYSLSRTFYDGAPFVGLGLCEMGARANPTRSAGWVEGSAFIDIQRLRFDGFGNKVAIADGLYDGSTTNGHVREIGYDPSFTYPVSEKIYVGNGKPSLITTATYDSPGFGVMTSSTEFNGHTSTYGYDSFGRLTAIVKPGDSSQFPTTSHAYSMSDPVRSDVYRYLPTGELVMTKSLNAASSVKTMSREEAGGGTFDAIQFVDGMGRKLASAEEDSTPGRFIIKAATRFTSKGTPREVLQPFESFRQGFEAPSLGARTITRYDARGRVREVEEPPDSDGTLGYVTTHFFPLGATVYDEIGVPTTSRDDGLGRLVEVVEANRDERYTTRYGYTPLGDLREILDAQSNRREYRFDGLRRKVTMRDPDKGVTTNVYDAASNVVATIDNKGQRVEYVFDGANRVLSEDFRDEGLPGSAGRTPDVVYAYDAPAGAVDSGDGLTLLATNTKGQLAWVSDISGFEHGSFDARGRRDVVVKQVRDPDSGILESFKLTRSFDSLDRVRATVFPDNDRITYDFSPRNLPDRIAAGSDHMIVASQIRSPAGKLARTELGNGVAIERDYDPRLRLTANRAVETSGAREALMAYAYRYDLASRLLQIDDVRMATSDRPSGSPDWNSQRFVYDDLRRLTSAEFSTAANGQAANWTTSVSLRYDSIGNLTSQEASVPTFSGEPTIDLGGIGTGGGGGTTGRSARLPGDPPGPHSLSRVSRGDWPRQDLAYDGNGNVTDDGRMTSRWDFNNRLLQVSSDGMTADYVYDYAGRRVAKKVQDPKSGEGVASELFPFAEFEVRDATEVKTALQGDWRLAEKVGFWDETRDKVQRLRLRPGWNLVAVNLDGSDAAARLLATPQVSSTWIAGNDGYTKLSAGAVLGVGTVIWVRAESAVVIPIRGRPVSNGSNALESGRFAALVGERSFLQEDLDAAGVRVGFSFDAASQKWRVRGAGLAAGVGDGSAMPPGAVVFVKEAQPAASLGRSAIARDETFLVLDHRASTDTRLGRDGKVVESTRFLPFGGIRWARNSSGRRNPYLFGQKYRDAESGYLYFEARYLAPAIGAFLGADPLFAANPAGALDSGESRRLLRRPQGLNLYRFVSNDPLNQLDPTGLSGVAIGDNGEGSAIGDALRHVPVLGGMLGAAGDFVTGAGNTALGAVSVGQSGTLARGLAQMGSGVANAAKILGTDAIATVAGAVGTVVATSMAAADVLTFGNVLSGGSPVKAFNDLLASILIPDYGMFGGAGWGVTQGFKPEWILNQSDVAAYAHDRNLNEIQWIKTNYSSNLQATPVGPVGAAYTFIGTIPFGLVGLCQGEHYP